MLREPLPVAVEAAHRHGLDLIAVLKPYAGASIITSPEGSPDGRERAGLRRIGGVLADAFGYLEQHPEWRIARDPSKLIRPRAIGDVAAIRLTKSDDAPTRIDREHIEIWTSPGNWQYRRRDIPFTVEDSMARASGDVVDYFGRVVTKAGDPVRSLTLRGLALDEPYVLVTTTFGDGPPDFLNTATAMIEALDRDDRPIPLVTGTRSATAYGARDFRTNGLEFDCGYGLFVTALDANNAAPAADWDAPQGGCIAFALGRNMELSGAPSESIAGVQYAWLAWVEWVIDAGVDGVDFRISGHGTHTDDPLAYGFNDEVLAGLRRQGIAETLDTIRRERGNRYTQFLGRARETLRRSGRSMHVHLHTEAFRPSPVHGQLMGFPGNIDFQWQRWLEERLADAATLRVQWYESLGPPNNDDLPGLLDEPVVAETIQRAKAAGVPLVLNRYAMEGGRRRSGDRLEHYLDDLEWVYRDGRLDGFDLYEFWALARPSTDGSRIEPIGDFLPKLAERTRKLGLS
jgi:hypothetical protein